MHQASCQVRKTLSSSDYSSLPPCSEMILQEVTLDAKQSSPAGGRGLLSYATCTVVDVSLNISLRLRKCQCVSQGMSPFECCQVVVVNFSFSLRLRLCTSVRRGASSCADCYVLEWKLFFSTLSSSSSHSTFICFILGGPIGGYTEHPWDTRYVYQASCQGRRHCYRQTTRAYRLVVR